MRICFVINDFIIGGAEKLIHDLANYLCQNGYDVTIILTLPTKRGALIKTLNKDVRVLSLGKGSMISPMKLYRLSKLLGNYDIVHVNLFPSFYMVFIASFFSKKAMYLYTEHSTWNKRRGYAIFRIIEKFVYSRYAKLIAVSDAVKDEMISWQPKIKNNICVIENGVDLSVFQNSKQIDITNHVSCLKNDDIKIVMVANFRPHKDHLTLIKSIKLLPDNVHAILIGDGETIEDCRQHARNLYISARVHFLGSVPDVSDILKSCDIFVLSSKWEGFGLSAIEAMAAKIPVIVSDLPGVADVVGEAALKFEPGNFKQLANNIDHLISEHSLYDKMVKLGSEQMQRYSIQRVASKYLDCFQQLVRIQENSL